MVRKHILNVRSKVEKEKRREMPTLEMSYNPNILILIFSLKKSVSLQLMIILIMFPIPRLLLSLFWP